MALITGFDHDIFISYAHLDNQPIGDEANGWIDRFFNTLKIMLAQRFGKPLNIWYDNKKIDGNTHFNEFIEKSVKRSAIMISVNSPGYFESAYCKKELETFADKINREKIGPKVGDLSRIIHVLRYDIPFKEWSIHLSGRTGFHFHTETKGDGKLGMPLKTNSTGFEKKMDDLVEAVYELLKTLQKEQNPSEITEAGNTNEFAIYLGEVADTLRTPRKRIINELENKGFKVLTGVPPPDEHAAHEKATKEALDGSNLTIHLLDKYPGREIVGISDMCYPQKQTELALTTDKSQMIWVPTELDLAEIEDENYKSFLTDLENRQNAPKNYEFIRGSKATLAKEIIDLAEQIKSQPVLKSTDEKLYVLINTHINDQRHALALYSSLLSKNIQPYLVPEEDDPRKSIKLFEESIRNVTRLVFLYGDVSKDWLLERMSFALQLIVTKNYPIDSFYVLIVPPFKKNGDIAMNQKFLKIKIIDDVNSLLTDLNGAA